MKQWEIALAKAQETRTAQLLDPERYQIREHRPLKLEYERIAGNVNKRIRAIKRLTKNPAYPHVDKMATAYMQRMADLRGYKTKAGYISTKAPKSEAEMRIRIKDMQHFLSAPSSFKSGIDLLYKSRIEKFKEKYGIEFDMATMELYFEGGLYDEYEKKYGSGTALKAIGQIQKNDEVVRKQMAQHKKKVVIAEESELQDTVDKLLLDRKLLRSGLY